MRTGQRRRAWCWVGRHEFEHIYLGGRPRTCCDAHRAERGRKQTFASRQGLTNMQGTTRLQRLKARFKKP